MAFCSPCPVGDLTNYTVDACDLKSATLKSGIARLVVVKCDSVFTAITDEDEWAALIDSDSCEVSHQGKASYPEPTYEDIEIDACGTKIGIDGKMEIEFTSFLLDTDTDLHNTFIDDFNKSATSYTMFLIGCDNRFYYQYGWTTGTNGGFGINSGKSFLKDDGKLKAMVIKAELDVTAGLYKSFAMTSAFKTALGI
jgi:hypothetical protein